MDSGINRIQTMDLQTNGIQNMDSYINRIQTMDPQINGI